MKRANTVGQTIDRALKHLAAQQKLDGGFDSLSGPQQPLLHADHAYATTFTPALILAALSRVDTAAALNVRTKLADFLVQQKSEHWSFNYWTRGGQAAKDMPYPDDLDDTFCALAGLYLHDPNLVDEAVLASMVKLLVATEAEVGGPYRTWLVPADSPEVWRDVDLAVNANIAYVLSLVSNPLPKLTAFMEQAITQQAFQSPYYPGPYPTVYYLARAYRGAQQGQLVDFLLARRQADGSWGTPLHTALAMSSLLRLKEHNVESAAEYLVRTQASDGSWPAEAFCLDPARDGKTYYSGASALTTAFAIEALQAYRDWGAATRRHDRRLSSREALIQKTVVAQATRELKALDKDVRLAALDMIQRTMHSKNAREITLLPWLVFASLRTPPALPEQLFVDLGLANLYGWVAYTIYDDFLDGEGEVRLLSAANVAMRRSLDTFIRALPEDRVFHEYVRAIFDTIDAANTWEVVHCRFAVRGDTIIIGKLPPYGNRSRLADRSIGHALPALGVLAASGSGPDTPAATSLLMALRHYIIARQLNDDAHDIRDDLQAGRITFVLAAVLRELEVKPGEQSLPTLVPNVERQFWHHTLGHICQHIERHITLSRKALQQSAVLKPDNVIEKLLAQMDASLKDTRASVTQAEKFLHTYRSK